MALRSRIPQIRARLAPAVEAAVERSAVFVQKVASDLVPVDTSALKRTIRVEGPETAGASASALVRAGDPSASRPNDGQPVIYAGFIEYGTSQSAAQPFLTPAARAIKPEVEVRKELKKVLR